jgi:DNA (cytosine-5)-methyltransferase 1
MELNKPVSKSGLTLGSLFDGSGGFPLGGLLSGIQPVWASEVEPFPIRVTTKRLPFMKHYGDVSKMNGGEIEPVDIITFGSPCQDLSIAGKRAGIHEGERSNLFFQAIRIIREMREKTNGQYPRYCVWENVPGAFSSNRGDDFKAVLEAVIGVKEEGIEVPSPENHRWPKADVYLGDGWSVAYRVLDAQYWSVPQRRARIYLVADFAGGSAGEILFKSEGVSGYTPQGFRAWQGTAGGAEEGTGEAGGRPDDRGGILCVNTQGNSGVGITEEKSLALVAQDHGNHPAVLQSAGFSTEHSAQSRSIGYEEEMSPTLRAGVVPAAMLDEPIYIVRRLTPTECARLQGFPDWWCSDLAIPEPTEEEIAFWTEVWETWRMVTKPDGKPKTEKQIRKWLSDPYTDAAEYKLWGNGCALPCVYFVLSGIAWAAEKDS